MKVLQGVHCTGFSPQLFSMLKTFQKKELGEKLMKKTKKSPRNSIDHDPLTLPSRILEKTCSNRDRPRAQNTWLCG